jgi:hypothetical protein
MIEHDLDRHVRFFADVEEIRALPLGEASRSPDDEVRWFRGADGQVERGERFGKSACSAIQNGKLCSFYDSCHAAPDTEAGEGGQEMFDQVELEAVSVGQRHTRVAASNVESREVRSPAPLLERDGTLTGNQRDRGRDPPMQGVPFQPDRSSHFANVRVRGNGRQCPRPGMSMTNVTTRTRASIMTRPTAWTWASTLGSGRRRVVAS